MSICKKCNGNLRGGLIYCPVCLELINNSKLSKREGIRKNFAFEFEKPDQQFLQKHANKITLVLTLVLIIASLICLTLFFYSHKNLTSNLSEAIMLAFTFSSLIIFILAWVMLWSKVLVMDPLSAIFSLFLSWILYWYVLMISPQDYKKHLLAMLTALVLFSVCITSYTSLHMYSPRKGIILSMTFATSPLYAIYNFKKLIKAAAYKEIEPVKLIEP